MDANTKKYLDHLKAKGFDVSSLETQINGSPILEKVAASEIGGGLLRQQEFTSYMNREREERKALEEKVQQLASLHDSAGALSANPEAYKEALSTIASIEEFLISEGYNEEEVRKLSLVSKQGLTELIKETEKQPPTNTPAKETPAKKEDEEMTIDTSNFVDIKTFQEQSANNILGNVHLSARIAAATNRATKMGIEVTDEMLTKLPDNLRTGSESGKNIDQIFDETFGFSERQKVLDKEKYDKDMADAEARGRAAAAQEFGVPNRQVTRQADHSPVFRNITKTERKVEEKVDLDKVPTNKFGDAEYFRTRPQNREVGRENRAMAAARHYDSVLEGETVGARTE